MKHKIDPIDREILEILQQNCRVALAQIGDKVGLSAPSVMERIKRLEAEGVIRGYEAVLDPRKLGLDVTAFIGISISHPNYIVPFLNQVALLPNVQESHQVTGSYTAILKVKAEDTPSLGALIARINRIEGVTRSETTVVLDTHTERCTVGIPQAATEAKPRRTRRGPDPHHVEEPDDTPGKD